jgi:hypothetical protein
VTEYGASGRAAAQAGGRQIAGVRLTRNGPLVFVDAAGLELATGDTVLVTLSGENNAVEATVAVAPSQLVHSGGVKPAGLVTGRLASRPGSA